MPSNQHKINLIRQGPTSQIN